MISINIPGFRDLTINALVTDYNGTLAVDGVLIPGVSERLTSLARQIEIHVITADTFGLARSQLDSLPVQLTITPLESQAETKRAFVENRGADHVVALGNGRNDREMLKIAAIGIGLIQKEGGASVTLQSADLVTTSVLDALDLLQNPKRLIATLKS